MDFTNPFLTRRDLKMTKNRKKVKVESMYFELNMLQCCP